MYVISPVFCKLIRPACDIIIHLFLALSAIGSSVGPVRVQLKGVSRHAVAAMVEPGLDGAGFSILSGTCQRIIPDMPLGVKHPDYDANFRGDTRTYYTDEYPVMDR
jgi:hypothetical protein